MSNVLSSEEKRKLGRRLGARYVAVGSTMLILGAMVASLALAPAFFSVSVARASFAEPLEEREGRADGAQAARAQTLLDTLNSLLDTTTTPSDQVAQVLALVPPNVSVTGIVYRPGTLHLSGTSSGREATSALKAQLEASGLFEHVVVPVAALVAAEGGAFSVTLTLK